MKLLMFLLALSGCSDKVEVRCFEGLYFQVVTKVEHSDLNRTVIYDSLEPLLDQNGKQVHDELDWCN